MLKPSFLSNEYMVSDEGYILSKRNKPLKPSKNHNGYLLVNLMVNGKRIGVAVHTLVARAFCEGYQEGLTVNHKDGNKTNNKAENLEWVTSLENTHHAINILHKDHSKSKNWNAKKINMINKITGEVEKVFLSLMDAAEYLNPNATYEKLKRTQCQIWRVAKGLRKSYKGYFWRY